MFPLLTLVAVPSYSELAASTTAYISGLFTDLLPWALAITGLLLAGLFAKKVISAILGGVKPLVGGGRRGGMKGGRRGR